MRHPSLFPSGVPDKQARMCHRACGHGDRPAAIVVTGGRGRDLDAATVDRSVTLS
jgi:hypothetical protein